MADEADLAQGVIDEMLERQLAEHQLAAREVSRPDPSGYCLNPLCCEDLEPGRLFCGPECAREYERLRNKL